MIRSDEAAAAAAADIMQKDKSNDVVVEHPPSRQLRRVFSFEFGGKFKNAKIKKLDILI